MSDLGCAILRLRLIRVKLGILFAKSWLIQGLARGCDVLVVESLERLGVCEVFRILEFCWLWIGNGLGIFADLGFWRGCDV